MSEETENRLLKLFSRFIGLSTDAIEEKLCEHLNSGSKNYCRILSDRMLQSDSTLYKEVRDQNILIKTIRASNDKPPPESMSFPTFKFNEIIEQNWDTSDFKKQLSSRFFFVVFSMIDSSQGNKLVLKNAGFWSMPEADLNRIAFVWNDTKSKIEQGQYNGFLTKTKNPFAHVRPHGKNSSDTYEFNGKQVQKYSFWLNNTYIHEIINSIPNLSPSESDAPECFDNISECIVYILSESQNAIPSFKLKKRLTTFFPDLNGYEESILQLVSSKVVENTVFGYRLTKYKLEKMLADAPELVK